MKKLCILRCLEKSTWCTAASCLKALKDRNYGFQKLGEEECELVAVWTCNGCGEYTLKDEDGSQLQKKIDRILRMETDILYLSPCTAKKIIDGVAGPCPLIAHIAKQLADKGMEVIQGKE